MTVDEVRSHQGLQTAEPLGGYRKERYNGKDDITIGYCSSELKEWLGFYSKFNCLSTDHCQRTSLTT